MRKLKYLHGKFLSIVCLLAFLTQQGQSAISYVSNTYDTGIGSLRQAVKDTNEVVGPNSILWTASYGGIITLGSDLPSINTNTTLDVTDSTSPVTITSVSNASIPLGGAITFRNNTVSCNWTINSGISGSGSLEKTGSGNLILTGVNSYSGGTIISSGTLTINSDSALGNASGALTFNGGTLKTTAGITSTRSIILNAGGGTLDTNSYNLLLSGVISGSGALTKKGTGILVLSGSNIYTGGTLINSGALQLGADNSLPTNGNLTVSGNASFNMAGFTQSLGSYNGSGTLSMLLKQAVTNLSVSGNAALAGTLTLELLPQVVVDGQVFTPITAGSITGTFANIISPAALSFTPTYNPVSVVLTAGLVPFSSIAKTRNQIAVGNGLETFRTNPTGDSDTVLGNLYTLNSAQLISAFDQIGPFSLASMRGIGMTGSSIQSTAVNQRMTALANGSNSGFAFYKLNGHSTNPGILLASAGRSDTEVYHQSAKKNPGESWGFFASGVGTEGRIEEVTDSPDYTFHSGGIMMGIDYRINEHIITGLLGGYLDGRADISSPGTARVNNRSVRYGLYASGHHDTFYANLYAGEAANSFATERNIAFGNISRKASAKTKGDELNLSANTGYNIKTDVRRVVSPFIGLNYNRLMIDGFNEKGAESLNLNVSAQTVESFKSNLGVRYSEASDVNSFMVTVYVSAAWQHEFNDQSPIESQLSSGGMVSVTVGNFARDAILGGIGLSANQGGQITFLLDYFINARSHFVEHVFNAGLRVKWG